MLTSLIFFGGTGVVGDYALNAASRVFPSNATLKSLTPYWDSLGHGLGALSAGLTTLVASIITIVLAGSLGVENIFGVLLIALLVGFFGDMLLGASGVFGTSLDDWYSTVGSVQSACYGAAAIALSVAIGVSAETYFSH